MTGDKKYMIPKIIHYCWFGGKPLPELTVKCIESWKKFCPDYEIMRWDETNFDFASCDYAREAYGAKKWAFVSDYARLKVLVDYGGVYMDTDMELMKPIDDFLCDEAFAGFEDPKSISCGIMGCEKGYAPFADIADNYCRRHFLKADGGYDITTIVRTVTHYFSRYGFRPNGIKQTVRGYTIYPQDYFYPKNHDTLKMEMTANTCAIHHFAASWVGPWWKFKLGVKRLIGSGITEKIIAAKRFFRRITGRSEF